MPQNNLPKVKHVYQNYMVDSLRWNFFKPRADDVVVASAYKAGTTWVQTIVANLILAARNCRLHCMLWRRGWISDRFLSNWC